MIPRLLLLLVVASSALAQSRKLPDYVYPPIDLGTGATLQFTMVLPYVFFDSGSAVIPSRYYLFDSAAQTLDFQEFDLGPHALELHHHVLNIIGARMRRQTRTTIEITGTNSEQPRIGETIEISAARARAIRDYLARIWGIDTARMKLAKPRGFPRFRSNPKDPLGIVENRRAEIVASNPSLLDPTVTSARPSHIGAGRLEILDALDSNAWSGALDTMGLAVFWFIDFRFDSPELTRVQRTIISQWVPALLHRSRVAALGSTDVVGQEDRNKKLSDDRANVVITAVRRLVKQLGREADLISANAAALGENAQLLTNETPEGRFYNRSVLLYILAAPRQ